MYPVLLLYRIREGSSIGKCCTVLCLDVPTRNGVACRVLCMLSLSHFTMTSRNLTIYNLFVSKKEEFLPTGNKTDNQPKLHYKYCKLLLTGIMS